MLSRDRRARRSGSPADEAGLPLMERAASLPESYRAASGHLTAEHSGTGDRETLTSTDYTLFTLRHPMLKKNDQNRMPKF